MITMKKRSQKQIADDWIDFCSKNKSVSPFQEYDLSRIIGTHYLFFTLARREFPVFYEFFNDGKPIMIAPLAKRISPSGIQYVSFAAAATIAFQDFIYADSITDDEIKGCINLLLKKCGSIKLENLPQFSRVYRILDQSMIIKEHVNITLPLRGSYDSYFNSLSKHAKQNVRTAYNRLKTDEHVYSVEKIIGGGYCKRRTCTAYGCICRQKKGTL